ncbi:MAG TPA: hypothetical protein VF395_10565 [Polyangiaceae bacterium]
MTAFVRAILWVLLVIAPGGVFLLPLLVGDAVARRKQKEKATGVGGPSGAVSVAVPASVRSPCGELL